MVERILRALAELVRMPEVGISTTTTAEINRLHSGIATDLDAAVILTELSAFEEHAFGVSDNFSSLPLSGMVRQAQAVFLISNSLTTARELEEWARLPIPAQNAEAVLRDAAAIQLSCMADLVHTDLPHLPSVEGINVAATDRSQPEGTENHRWHLLCRLTEQIHLFGLS